MNQTAKAVSSTQLHVHLFLWYDTHPTSVQPMRICTTVQAMTAANRLLESISFYIILNSDLKISQVKKIILNSANKILS